MSVDTAVALIFGIEFVVVALFVTVRNLWDAAHPYSYECYLSENPDEEVGGFSYSGFVLDGQYLMVKKVFKKGEDQ